MSETKCHTFFTSAFPQTLRVSYDRKIVSVGIVGCLPLQENIAGWEIIKAEANGREVQHLMPACGHVQMLCHSMVEVIAW